MIIGIDASRAFLKNRTGIEEYSYQVIKHLMDKLESHRVILYVRENSTNYEFYETTKNLKLPSNWSIKIIKWPYLWTQVGLSLEMLFHPVDVLFIPAHTVPFIHPCNTVVTVHGLEYEFCPQAYFLWERIYMRWSIKNSCKWAKKIIAVSENTKKDLMKLYKVPEKKIEVIYEGVSTNYELGTNVRIMNNYNSPYLLFIGRLEERKNIVGITKTFEILKEQYKLPHKLVLAGNYGYGKEKIIEEVKNNNYAKDIILPGYVSEEEKWELLKNAEIFLFPTFYEGFGIPILEAQSVGVPVVAGDNSSIREIITISPSPQLRGGSGRGCEDAPCNLTPTLSLKRRGSILTAILADPLNAEQIADAAYKLISDKALRDDIIKKGYENVKRFSWEKCAEEIKAVILNSSTA